MSQNQVWTIFPQRRSSQTDKYSNEYSIFWDTGTQLQISFGFTNLVLTYHRECFYMLVGHTQEFHFQKFHPETLSQFKKIEFKKLLANLPVSSHTHTHTHSYEWITPFKIIQAQVNLSFHSGTCQLSTVSHSWHADSARQAAPVASHPQPEPLLFHLVHGIMESQNSRD